MPLDKSLSSLAPIRTRSRLRHRDVCLTLIHRADLLDAADRALLIAVYADGRSVHSLARADDPDPATLHQRSATLRRRVRRLARRLLTPTYQLVRTQSDSWPPVMVRVGRACFVQGLSMRDAARKLRLSIHTVRSLAQSIRALAAAAPSPWAQPPREVAA